jgi:hypothetical protein
VTTAFRLPAREALPAIVEKLAIASEDRRELIAGWPSAGDRELWSALERAHGTVVGDMGGFESIELPGSSFASTPGGRYFYAYVYLAALDEVRAFHADRGISDEVSWATLADLGHNLARDRVLFGEGGLRTSNWLTLHFRGALYELGRLQYNRMRVRAAHVAGAFAEGAPALGVHIPERGPLTAGSCDESLRRAGMFFARHFPETPTRLALCTSWLLDPQLAEYLAPDTNIMRFQRRFTLVGEGWGGDEDIVRFVFHRIAPTLAELPQRTTLERAIVTHLSAGKHWRNRTGWLELP